MEFQPATAGSQLVFSSAYVASKGNHLQSVREANPGVFGRVGNLQQRRRFPDFTGIEVASAEGNMTYHSMQLSANKRLSNGVTVLASYTWSKNIDNGSGNGQGDATPRDGSNFSAEKALSNNHIAHRVVGSFIWELPAWKNTPGFLRQALGGWELNGIISLESGLYINVISGRDNSGTGINADRPDLVGNPFLPGNRSRGELIARYFNPDAFRQNATGTFGNAGRNLIEGPGKAGVDLGLVKTFLVHERHRLQFRAEAFNAFNRVNLDNPNGNISNPTVGRITSAGLPRVFQLALRYQF